MAAVTGKTTSNDLPNTTTTLSGPSDAFLAKFRSTGNPTAQYIGGSGEDEGFRVALRRISSFPFPTTLAYIAGRTDSANFPATNLGFGPACVAGGSNIFVWRSSSLFVNVPEWSGCIGAQQLSVLRSPGMAISSVGAARVHVASFTTSTTLSPPPTTGQLTNAGSDDAWIVVFRE